MVAIVFLLQPIMKKLCDNLRGIPRLIVADMYMMFSVMAVICLWRGIWNLLDIYFIPGTFNLNCKIKQSTNKITENRELSCWVTHWVAMIILMMMGCSNSVLVRGVCLDCEEPDGTCVVFPCNYLKDIFDQEKDDTWCSIWSGLSKANGLPNLQKSDIINVINYHIVDMKDVNISKSIEANKEVII